MLESLRPVFSTELQPLNIIISNLVGIQVEALIILAAYLYLIALYHPRSVAPDPTIIALAAYRVLILAEPPPTPHVSHNPQRIATSSPIPPISSHAISPPLMIIHPPKRQYYPIHVHFAVNAQAIRRCRKKGAEKNECKLCTDVNSSVFCGSHWPVFLEFAAQPENKSLSG